MTLQWGQREALIRAAEDATIYPHFGAFAAMKRTRAKRRKAMGYSRAVADYWVAAGDRANQREKTDA